MPRRTSRDTPTLFDDPGGGEYNPELREHIAKVARFDAAVGGPPTARGHRYSAGDPRTLSFRDVKVSKHTDETQRIKPVAGNFHHMPHETQLPLLMSARDIKANYAPAEGDRMYHGTNTFANLAHVPVEIGPDPRAGELTQRPARTDRVVNNRTGITDRKKARLLSGYTQDVPKEERQYRRKQGVNLIAPRETDEQMWDRKLSEAQKPDRGGHPQSMVEHLASGGDVGLIHLGLAKNPMLPLGEQKASKPMVAGSQHRIAAMNHLNPDQLLPVMHHENIVHAKFEPEYD